MHFSSRIAFKNNWDIFPWTDRNYSSIYESNSQILNSVIVSKALVLLWNWKTNNVSLYPDRGAFLSIANQVQTFLSQLSMVAEMLECKALMKELALLFHKYL